MENTSPSFTPVKLKFIDMAHLVALPEGQTDYSVKIAAVAMNEQVPDTINVAVHYTANGKEHQVSMIVELTGMSQSDFISKYYGQTISLPASGLVDLTPVNPPATKAASRSGCSEFLKD